MEAIAREAGVAKPTLYAYFADKDAVFQGIAGLVVTAVTEAVEAAMAAEGDAIGRVGAALAAKHKTVARLIGASAHTEELHDFGRMLAPLARLEQEIEARIAGELAAAGMQRPRPLAQLLIAAADGVSRRAAVAEIGPAVRLLAERLLRPELDPRP